MTYSNAVPAQVSTIAQLRWRMFVNSLRSKRGKMELASRTIVTLSFAVAGIGGFLAAAGSAWYFTSQGKAEFLPILLWLIFLFWQFFPVMATAFTNNPDSSDLLRFPLSYRAYFLIRLAYGFFDPASALGSLALFGVFLGISAARPLLIPWSFVVLVTFALFNLVLMQTVFSWIERWLAQRRTREILGVLFIVLMLSFQLIGPMMQHFGKGPHPGIGHATEIAEKIQAFLPPGMAGTAIAEVSHSRYASGAAFLLVLTTLTLGIGSLLHLRLRAQFRGENLSEAAARPTRRETQEPRLGWNLPGLSPPVVTVFEKEVRYLLRSGPMLLTVIMPMFMLVLFRLGPLNQLRHSSFMNRAPDMAFPGAAAYTLLVLTNLVYNTFGGDGGGIQFFYASPVTFRQITLGKNLTHLCILLANALFAWIAVTCLYGAPHFAVTIATCVGLLFAAPLNFTVGNLLSIYAPKKRDFSTFGRQNASQTTVLASLGVQLVIVGAGAAAFGIAHVYEDPWIAAAMFLALAAMSIPLYIFVLNRLDGIAVDRQETLMSELTRA